MRLASFFRILSLKKLVNGASGHWWSQRVSAILLIIFGGWFLISLVLIDSYQFKSIYDWVSTPFNALMLSLLVTFLAYHSCLGIEVIIEDYVPDSSQQLFLLRLSKMLHFAFFSLSLIFLSLIFTGLLNG